MAQLQSDPFLLVQDTLTAFLNDISVLESMPLEATEASGASTNVVGTKKRRKTCARQRDRLQAVRDEAASLQRQLDILHENHELRESLDRLVSSSSNDGIEQWKFRASREQSRRQYSSQQNELLRHRVAANAKILKRMGALVNKLVPKTGGSKRRRFMSLSDDATLAFSALRARLDARTDQLDTLVPPCDLSSAAIASRSRVNPGSWVMSTTSDRGVSLVFSDFFATPFDSTLVFDVVNRFTLLDGVEVHTEKYVDRIAQCSEPNRMQLRDRVSGGSESGRCLIFRRIKDSRGTILLFEGSAYWQTSDEQEQQVAMQDSGWAFIAAQSNEVTIVQYGGCMKIHATDEASIETNDALVSGIVRATKSRNSQQENVFMDLFLQEARRQ